MIDPDDGVLEARIPADRDPYAGFGVLALHSHTEEQPCDDTCSVYDRTSQ